jgi:hypothetical protein
MILLGAGASKAFGLPTLQDLTTDLIELMQNKGYIDLVQEIIVAFKKFGIKPDFENIYSTIEALANPYDYIGKGNGVIAYFAYKANVEKNIHSGFSDILSDMRDLVYKKCTLSKFTPTHQKIFDNLMKACALGEVRYLPPIIGGGGQERILDRGQQTIVTTNYDPLVELYHYSKNIKLATGFKIEESQYWAPLDLTEYGRKFDSNWLIKLHGSIWQFKKDNGQIIQTITDPAHLNLDFTIKENLMIYPVGQKPILEHPYFELYQLFRSQRWTTLVAIGYSFRDDPVNTAIIERMKTAPPPPSKLIVVNMDAEEAVRNLAPPTAEIDNRIIRINMPFEDNDSVFDNIYTAMGCKDWKDFQKNQEFKKRDLRR